MIIRASIVRRSGIRVLNHLACVQGIDIVVVLGLGRNSSM